MRAVPIPSVEIGVAGSAVVLGLMILLSVRPPIMVAAVIVGAFAVFHGHAHGTELPTAAEPLAYGAGFVLVTGLLHATGIAMGLVDRWVLGVMALRGRLTEAADFNPKKFAKLVVKDSLNPFSLTKSGSLHNSRFKFGTVHKVGAAMLGRKVRLDPVDHAVLKLKQRVIDGRDELKLVLPKMVGADIEIGCFFVLRVL